MAESGIYEIVNLVNGKRYVGSAQCFQKRWNLHRLHLRRGTHHSRHLQSSWRKYGESNFAFRVVRECEPDNLLDEENAEFTRRKPEYNVCPVAGSTRGRKFTAEAKAKIGDAHRGKRRNPDAVKASADKLRGRKRPEVSERLQGNQHAKGHRHTDEWKAESARRLRLQYAEGLRSRERPPEYRAKISATLTGRKATPEHRANQSAAQLGKKRGPYKRRSL